MRRIATAVASTTRMGTAALSVTPVAHVQRLLGAQCHHLYIDATGLLEGGQQGGGRNHDGLRLGGRKCYKYNS